jgi:hypothetical protein
MLALGDEAAGPAQMANTERKKLPRWEGDGREDLRVLTTLTNSHTANGVSWSPVLRAGRQHFLYS